MSNVHLQLGSPSGSDDAADDRAWRRPERAFGPAAQTETALVGDQALSVVIVATDGVLIDEALTYRQILGQWPSVRLVVAGPRAGRIAGVGGHIVADAALSDLDRCDVLVVPGAIGSEIAGGQALVARPVAVLARNASWVLACSTGTLLLARSGVELGDAAATHWLARDRLRSYGVASIDEATCARGNVLTARGRVGAHESAVSLTAHLYGSDVAGAIADAVAPRETAPRRRRRWSCRWRTVVRRRSAS